MGIAVCRERRTTKRPIAASRRTSGALTRSALNVESRASLPVAGRTVTGIGIHAGAAANAGGIEISGIDNVIDNAKRSIPSIVTYYASSGNLRMRVPLASKIALLMAAARTTIG